MHGGPQPSSRAAEQPGSRAAGHPGGPGVLPGDVVNALPGSSPAGIIAAADTAAGIAATFGFAGANYWRSSF